MKLDVLFVLGKKYVKIIHLLSHIQTLLKNGILKMKMDLKRIVDALGNMLGGNVLKTMNGMLLSAIE